MSLCLTAAGSTLALAWSVFTLAWTHSVERIEWREDWRVTPAGLALDEARVRGAGAGMEPPPSARLEGGWWRYEPAHAAPAAVVLARSDAVADWRLCRGEHCVPLGALVGDRAKQVIMHACGD
jgi:hypothetical protein